MENYTTKPKHETEMWARIPLENNFQRYIVTSGCKQAAWESLLYEISYRSNLKYPNMHLSVCLAGRLFRKPVC